MKTPNVIHMEPAQDGETGFPMEIGLVLHNGAAYCLVTRPGEEGFPVDAGREQGTGLTPEVRGRRGLRATEVAAELNRALAGDTVYFDARSDAAGMLARLFAAGGTEAGFAAAPLQSLLSPRQVTEWERAAAIALDEQRQIRNRASDKAYVLQQTCLRSSQGNG